MSYRKNNLQPGTKKKYTALTIFNTVLIQIKMSCNLL